MGDIKSKIKKLIEKAPKNRRFFFWKNMMIRIAIIFSATAVASVLGLSVINDTLALYKPARSATIRASDTRELAKKLYECGIIDHPQLFYLYAELKMDKELDQERAIIVNSDMDYRQLIKVCE